MSSQIYDPETGQQVALNYFDGADLIVFVGTKKIEPLGTLVVHPDHRATSCPTSAPPPS